MMTSKINTEYTEFCRIMKRSRWSGFNNTHQSHYTMTESNRSLPPAYFNLLHTVSELSYVHTEYTGASTTLDHVKDLDHVEHPEEIIQPTDYNLRYKTVFSCVICQLCLA